MSKAKLIDGMADKGAKFADYFDYSEPLSKIPSHRALALFRGRNEGILSVDLTVDADDVSPVLPAVKMVADTYAIADRGRPADKWLMEAARFAWKVKLALHLELDLMGVLRDKAEEEAIQVFAKNLKDLLLRHPLEPKPHSG